MSGVVVFLPSKPTQEDVGRALVRVGQMVKHGEKPHVILSGGSFPDWARNVVTGIGGKITLIAPPKCDMDGKCTYPDELKGQCETWPGNPNPNLPCLPNLIVHPDSPETSWEIETPEHNDWHHKRPPYRHGESGIREPCCIVIRERLKGAARRYLEVQDGGPLPECADKLQNIYVAWRRPIPNDSSPDFDLDCSVSDIWKRFEFLLEKAKARGVNVVVELHRGSR